MARSSGSTGLLTAAAAAAALTAAPLGAQSGSLSRQCASAARPLQDACQKSTDIFDLMAPQLGTALAGGNAVIGQGGAHGRVGRFSVGLRATALEGSLPDLQNATVSTRGAQVTDYDVNEQYLGAPALDAAIAVFPGFGVGPVRVGAVDVLGTATYIPEYEGDGFSVLTPDGSLKIGYGARVGLLQETPLLPGVAVTVLRRDLPRVDLLGVVAASGSRLDDTLGVRALEVETTAWRVVAGKRLAFLGLAAGVGQDRYSSGARLGAVVNESVLGLPVSRFESQEIALSQTLTRTNYFGNVALNLPGLRIAGEIGRAQGGTVGASYNSFAGRRVRADDARLYFGAAVRIGN